jgi:hypothetical protein
MLEVLGLIAADVTCQPRSGPVSLFIVENVETARDKH